MNCHRQFILYTEANRKKPSSDHSYCRPRRQKIYSVCFLVQSDRFFHTIEQKSSRSPAFPVDPAAQFSSSCFKKRPLSSSSGSSGASRAAMSSGTAVSSRAAVSPYTSGRSVLVAEGTLHSCARSRSSVFLRLIYHSGSSLRMICAK